MQYLTLTPEWQEIKDVSRLTRLTVTQFNHGDTLKVRATKSNGEQKEIYIPLGLFQDARSFNSAIIELNIVCLFEKAEFKFVSGIKDNEALLYYTTYSPTVTIPA